LTEILKLKLKRKPNILLDICEKRTGSYYAHCMLVDKQISHNVCFTVAPFDNFPEIRSTNLNHIVPPHAIPV